MRRILILIGLLASAPAAALPAVRTESGVVAGRTEAGTEVFRGIPFAAPPVGALRWRGPQPAARWTGVRDAAAFAAPCMQTPASSTNPVAPSEDCLYLNVWTPSGAKARNSLPVLVWIHGGAFRGGTSADPRIAGDLIARRGVVVVTIQYRLGALGFLSHPALSAESSSHVSGNYGLLDQIAALKWVRRNIARFGGDPRKVTIGGMSAGAISAAMLAAAPDARGLFRAIISMSGGSFAPPRSPAEAGENMEPLARSEQNGLAFASQVGASTLAELRAMPAEKLLAADGRGVSWPVIDGRIVPGDEYVLFGRKRVTDVPLLLGTTSDEGFAFSRIRTLDDYKAEVSRRFGSFAPEIFRGYPASTDAEAIRQGRDFTRDAMFGWGTWAWASLQARYGSAPSFAYYFDHVGPRDARTPPDAGATHGSDQPYPFGIAHQDRAWTEADQRISAAMLGYFVNFVKTGNPNGAGLPAWPTFATANQQVLRITDDLAAGPVANRSTIELIDRYMAIRRSDGGLGAPR